jgi:hypothetical protein
VSTNRTLPAFELHQLIGAPAPASRAYETIRPPAGGQIFLASFFVGKPRLEFSQGFRKRWTTHSPYTTASGLLKQPDKQKVARRFRRALLYPSTPYRWARLALRRLRLFPVSASHDA